MSVLKFKLEFIVNYMGDTRYKLRIRNIHGKHVTPVVHPVLVINAILSKYLIVTWAFYVLNYLTPIHMCIEQKPLVKSLSVFWHFACFWILQYGKTWLIWLCYITAIVLSSSIYEWIGVAKVQFVMRVRNRLATKHRREILQSVHIDPGSGYLLLYYKRILLLLWLKFYIRLIRIYYIVGLLVVLYIIKLITKDDLYLLDEFNSSRTS